MRKNAETVPFHGKQALRLTSGSFAYYYLQLHYANYCFFFAFRTKKREIEHYRFSVYFCFGFRMTDWTANPERGSIFCESIVFHMFNKL